MVDIEAVYTRFAPNLEAFYEAIRSRHQKEVGGKRSFFGSDYAPRDWWASKPDRPVPPAPPSDVREEEMPKGEGWVVEVRGYTYWHPEERSETKNFIRDTLLKSIIERSHPASEAKTRTRKSRLRPWIDPSGQDQPVFLYASRKTRTLPGDALSCNRNLISQIFVEMALPQYLALSCGPRRRRR